MERSVGAATGRGDGFRWRGRAGRGALTEGRVWGGGGQRVWSALVRLATHGDDDGAAACTDFISNVDWPQDGVGTQFHPLALFSFFLSVFSRLVTP